jgi:cell division protease FtsH
MRQVLLIGVLFVLLFALFNLANSGSEYPNVPYSDFVAQVDTKKVDQVNIIGNKVLAHVEGAWFKTTLPENDTTLVPRLLDHNIRVNVYEKQEGNILLNILISWFPMLLLIGVWIWFMRRQQGGSGLGGFGASRAKQLTQLTEKKTFADVAGCDEAKQEVEEIVAFLKDPQKFSRLGGKIPKGCLLVGPPGTGKTLLARAIAGEANVPFFTISGSDFVEMFVGVGASRVRDMFAQGKKNAPCIIFIDEIDAVGRHRGAGVGGGHDEREQTLNQLLVEMDGFEANAGVIIIAATNRPDVLDPALLRPGRFDRQITIPNPDILGREQILKVHVAGVTADPSVNLKVIARGTPGFSGADLANLVNEAALHAARANKKTVTMVDFEAAKDKVLMGAERRSTVLTEQERKLIAYHEAGHAIVGLNCDYHDPLHKVTIIPRGRAMGMTVNLPERDRFGWTKSELLDRLASMFGGREAEIMIFGQDHVTTGAGGDISSATDIARRMVTEYGMSEVLGRVRLSSNDTEVFLGRAVTEHKNVSEETARLIDSEIRALVEQAEERARQILENKAEDLHKLAIALLTYETLSGEEVTTVLADEEVHREVDVAPLDITPVKRGSVPLIGRA